MTGVAVLLIVMFGLVEVAVARSRRRNLGLVILLSLLLSTIVGGPSPAFAVSCPAQEETLFVHAITQPGGADFTDAFGTGHSITVRDRDLANCDGSTYNPEAHSTAHLARADGMVGWLEIGWVEFNRTNHTFRWFYEYNDGSCANVCGGDFGDGGPLPALGSNPYVARFWMQRVAGQNSWQMWVDWTGDGTADASVTTPVLGFHKGLAQGETGRRGGAGTGALELQNNLDYRDAGNVWQNWPSNGHVDDAICNWDWQRKAADRYITVRTSTSC